MKNKIKILLAFSALFIFCINNLFAMKITLSGGTRGPSGVLYNYIHIVTNGSTISSITCAGPGPNSCPANRGQVSGTSGTWYDLQLVFDMVEGKIRSGERTGEVNYKNDLPVSWTGNSIDDYTIDLKETGYNGPTK
jgi:hypothetical protein